MYISAETATLLGSGYVSVGTSIRSSVAVLAEISFRSPRKIIIFIIQKYINRIKVSKKQST